MEKPDRKLSGRELFPHIFQPGKVGKFTTPNRLKYAACSISDYCTHDGFVTPREVYRCEVIGQTGAGMLTNQGAYPDPKGEGKAYFAQAGLYDERLVPGVAKVAEMWRRDAPKSVKIEQILHGGRYGGHDLDYCIQPSPVPQKIPHFGKPPREATKDDVQRQIGEHVNAARLAILAGFDGVEITSFMGYMLSNWNSRFTNKRTDEYGGSLENRCRFMVELFQAIRKEIGPHLILGCRLPSTELLGDDGNTDEECLEVAKIAETAGIDYISVCIGWHESPTGAFGRMYGPSKWLYTVENWKKVLKLPLIYGTELDDPFEADKAIAEGLIDYWELCRPMLADPERIHKTEKGDLKAIKPCIELDMMCLAKGLAAPAQPYCCTVNPCMGHEGEDAYKLRPSEIKKKVIVIGAGPAGVEAALAAHKRGHDVVIYDEKERVGGQLLAIAKFEEHGWKTGQLIEWYEEMLWRENIRVELGVTITPSLVYEWGPYPAKSFILATGATIERPSIPGMERDNVYTVFDVMEKGITPAGDTIAVVHGGRLGLYAGLYLHSLGKKIVIAHEGARVDETIAPTYRWRYRQWIRENKVPVVTTTWPLSFSEEGLLVRNGEGKEDLIKADAVVLAKRAPKRDLFGYLEIHSDELYIAGDCIEPGYLYTAIHGGYRVGCQL